MIPVEKEPSEWSKDCGGLIDNCNFCNNPTKYWHMGTNNPVCPTCAKTHQVKELHNWFSGKPNNPETFDRNTAAVSTLKKLGYEWVGGALWKPPIGNRNAK